MMIENRGTAVLTGLLTGLTVLLAGCGSQQTAGNTQPPAVQASDTPTPPPISERPAAGGSQVRPTALPAKSFKRGVAYDLASSADLSALAPGVSWWYNWSPAQSTNVPATANTQTGTDFVPMVWGQNFDTASVENQIRINPNVRYLLVMNEPNLTDQANLTPTQAAAVWPRYEQIATDTGVKLVGPAMNWGTLSGYNDPVVWLDAFYAAYRSGNAGRDPRIDYLAFHWYDYGLEGQLDRLKKYGKPFWVTEFANWHSQNDGAQIDTLAKQKTQMASMVAALESRADVFRYAWFTGRWNNDTHFTSLLGASGQLTELGQYYLSLPFSASSAPAPAPTSPASCSTTNAALNKPASTSSSENPGSLGAAQAFDGNASTRWASLRADPQWLQVDLGSSQAVCQVVLQWEAAYGKAFEIQVSDTPTDPSKWVSIYSTTTGTGGTQTLNVNPSGVAGRYLRMYGTVRGTGYGYSLFEFKVFTTQH